MDIKKGDVLKIHKYKHNGKIDRCWSEATFLGENDEYMNFRYRLMQFMMGRYGTDKLNTVLFVIALILSFSNLFIRSIILQMLIYLIMVYGFFRMFSRNTQARRRENQWFAEKINFFKRKRDFYKQRKADKFHVYKKCPNCKAILRLPHRVGKHTTSCPKCGKEFKVKVRK